MVHPTSRARVILISPEGFKFHYALRFQFDALNNEDEYEALIAGLRIAEALKVKNLIYHSDSQLIVNQVLGEYQAKGLKIVKYLQKKQTRSLEKFMKAFVGIMQVDTAYLKRSLDKDITCQRSIRTPMSLSKMCDKCQRFSHIPRVPPTELRMMTSPYPFSIWGIDLIGALPTGRGGAKYVVVAVDFFTKWTEVKPLVSITCKKVLDFVVKNIVCRFGIPMKIVSDNRTEFDGVVSTQFCERNKIIKSLSSVSILQANGQVEAVNKTLKDTIKKKLDAAKGKWVDELPQVLWAHKTTEKTAMGHTPFSIAFDLKLFVNHFSFPV
ncbi:uncharacterized protein LOC133031437 [Cannabis sativa]|uniref:uncharacterized protein LOC133031437 n=1 Tax=Cannabis sativa TaxID=3483 RepID=UPI0029CA5B48|nr:uncharacterized protein LOC133031437 [Cannabis sativa]